LKYAKGRAFFIDHSPEDDRCKFELAELARDTLKKNGAVVEFVTFKGGHGWFEMPYQRLAKGFAWLDENHGRPSR
jgi:predicted esterase